jgi:hypothetical protein
VKTCDGAALTKWASVRVRSLAGQKQPPENQRSQCTAFWDPLDVLRQLSARPNSDEEEPLARGDFSTMGSTNTSTGATFLGRACKVQNNAMCKECSSESSFVNGCCQICGYVDAYSSPSREKFSTSLTTPRQYREFFEYEPFDPAKHKRGKKGLEGVLHNAQSYSANCPESVAQKVAGQRFCPEPAAAQANALPVA